jgi:hypothetical protein
MGGRSAGSWQAVRVGRGNDPGANFTCVPTGRSLGRQNLDHAAHRFVLGTEVRVFAWRVEDGAETLTLAEPAGVEIADGRIGSPAGYRVLDIVFIRPDDGRASADLEGLRLKLKGLDRRRLGGGRRDLR